MGTVVSLCARLVRNDRVLILADEPVRPRVVAAAVVYVRQNASIDSILALPPQNYISCTLSAEQDSATKLHYFHVSERVRIVAVLCLMKQPPREVIETLFPDARHFFMQSDHLRAVAELTA